jgi:perosamine synthetase
MASVQSVSLFHAFHSPEMEVAALEVLRSGQIASGPKVAEFEGRFGDVIGRSYVVCTNDMTSAVMIALHLAGVGYGDEVLTLAYSCMSSNAPIAMLGAMAVWVDMDPEHASMSAEDFERAISPRTKAAMIYHVAGYPGPTEQIAKICKRRGIVLIEDCNNALGATQNGVSVGRIGDYAVFSFYPNRQINAIDGGALACPDEQTAQRARRLRRFGINPLTFRDKLGEINPTSDITEVGWSASFNQLSAAVALTQLPLLTDRLTRTRRNALRLREQLGNLSRLRQIVPRDGEEPAYWAFLTLAEGRDELLAGLKVRGIHSSRLHYRNDDYSGFTAQQRNLPGTAMFLNQVLAMPCGWWLNDKQVDQLALVVRQECGA